MNKHDGLTRKDRIILFISDFTIKNGYCPSIREIGDAIGVHSTGLLSYYLNRLENENLITREAGKARTIRIL